MTHHTLASLILAAVAAFTAGSTIAEGVVRHEIAVRDAALWLEGGR